MNYFLLFSKSVTSYGLYVGLCTVWLANVIHAAAEKPLKQYTLQKTYNPI